MIRLTKIADYGVVLMSHFAAEPGRLHTASALSREAHMAVPTVSKVLKLLQRGGLLVSHRGATGGYSLARDPRDISVAEVISAMDGPIAVTECVEDSPGECSVEDVCRVRSNWQRINDAVRGALEGINLEEMALSFRDDSAAPPENLVHIRGRAL